MEKIIERYNANQLTTREGCPFTITDVQINPVSDAVDTILGTVTVPKNEEETETMPMQWNTSGNALGVVNVPTGNPQQPYQMMQARQFDLIVQQTLAEYVGE